jgi:hypothetical protein
MGCPGLKSGTPWTSPPQGRAPQGRRRVRRTRTIAASPTRPRPAHPSTPFRRGRPASVQLHPEPAPVASPPASGAGDASVAASFAARGAASIDASLLASSRLPSGPASGTAASPWPSGPASSTDPSGPASVTDPSGPASGAAPSGPASGTTMGGAHAPLVHTFPSAQSASCMHVVAHASPAHAYGAHRAATAVVQLPCPSQRSAAEAMPALHDAAPHTVSLPGSAHAPVWEPSHRPAHAPVPAHAARPPCGSPETGEQTPACPGTSHAAHGSVQAESQHTPSTQWFDAHCALPPHASPGPTCGTQTWPLQNEPAPQSPSAWQFPLHAAPPHV